MLGGFWVICSLENILKIRCIFSSFFFFRKNYLLLSCATSVRPSVVPSVRPSVEIISFRGNSLSNRPIDLKIGLNVREGVVHVRKAWFFEIRIASCNFFCNLCCNSHMLQFMQIAKDNAVFPDNEPFVFQLILQLVAKRIVHSEQQVEQDNPREIRFLYTMITMQCTLFF